ncbi:response regulator [Bacillus sp. FJAT-45037]|uniref:response regulator n=1 Tax=Bacillus sp. FJAT-45037 TaxID=2011007 RepID=UPI000C24C023|nr:response regulator [Bacillus sp. FJAT-45037]
MLTEIGSEVAGKAENGQIAIEKYNKLKPDIVTLEIVMQELDALKQIKNINANAQGIMCSKKFHFRYIVEKTVIRF